MFSFSVSYFHIFTFFRSSSSINQNIIIVVQGFPPLLPLASITLPLLCAVKKREYVLFVSTGVEVVEPGESSSFRWSTWETNPTRHYPFVDYRIARICHFVNIHCSFQPRRRGWSRGKGRGLTDIPRWPQLYCLRFQLLLFIVQSVRSEVFYRAHTNEPTYILRKHYRLFNVQEARSTARYFRKI